MEHISCESMLFPVKKFQRETAGLNELSNKDPSRYLAIVQCTLNCLFNTEHLTLSDK